jgi:DNA-binding MarR family transcriptional regulator
VGLAQCHALLAIPKNGGELSILSRELGVEASTLTRTLDSLDKARLVRRRADTEDRRKGRVELSPEGLAKVEQIDKVWNTWLASVLERIPEDKQGIVLEGVTLLAQAMATP